MMKKDLDDISVEVKSLSKIVTGLSVALDESKGNTITMSAAQDALFGISCYLDRIVYDLDEINNQMIKNSNEKGAKA